MLITLEEHEVSMILSSLELATVALDKELKSRKDTPFTISKAGVELMERHNKLSDYLEAVLSREF